MMGPRLTAQAWIAFGVMTSVGLIDAFIVFLRCDPIWAAGSIYIFISILLKVRRCSSIRRLTGTGRQAGADLRALGRAQRLASRRFRVERSLVSILECARGRYRCVRS